MATGLEKLDYDLTMGLWLQEWPGISRLTEIKIRFQVSNVLMILKGISSEGPKIAFVGGASLSAVCHKVRSIPGRKELKWRFDQYALDNFEKKE